MSQTINKTTVLTSLARMMGKRTLPQGVTDDWVEYIQTAFDYAWRYYGWGWSIRTAVLDMTNPSAIYMPADFDLDGKHEAMPNGNGDVVYLSQQELASIGQYQNAYALEYDTTMNRYRVIPGGQLSSLTVTYQVAPPTLGDDDVPFPSSLTVAIGATIYAKQGENPTRADITQEWDEFHAELDRHVARSEKNKPRQQVMNLQDYYGTYTGDTR